MHATPPLPCRWEGLTITAERIVDDFGRDWTQHAYPGRDGVEVEDMGKRPARFDVDAVFFGETWFVELDWFVRLVRSAPARTVGTFEHPFWGSFDGTIESVRVTHVDRKHNVGRVTFTFFESTAAPFAFEVSSSLASATAAAEAAVTTATAALAALPE